MKNLTYSLLAVAILAIGACKKGENGPVNTLSGRWNLIATYISTGAPGVWIAAGNQTHQYVQFNNDGKLLGNAFSDYATYAIKDTAAVVFSKKDNTIQNYRYAIKKDTLVLSPAGPIFCIEGCALKFTR